MQTEGYEPRESDNRLEMRASLSEAILQSEEIPASERHRLTQAVAAMSETELREALALLRKDKASMLRWLIFHAEIESIDYSLEEFETKVKWLEWSIRKAAEESEKSERLTQAESASESLHYLA